MREQREKTPHTGLSQMGTCLPQAGTRSVWGKISADFLGLCEQSLNGERDPGTHGPTGGQTALKKPHRPWLKEAVPCKDVTVNLPGHRGVGVGTHSARPMSESGGSNPGSTTNLWVTPGKVHPLSGPQFPCI